MKTWLFQVNYADPTMSSSEILIEGETSERAEADYRSKTALEIESMTLLGHVHEPAYSKHYKFLLRYNK